MPITVRRPTRRPAVRAPWRRPLLVGLAAALVATTGAVAAAAPTLPGPVPAVLPASTLTTGNGLTVENSFVSSTGWVKPGDSYPSRVLVKSAGPAPVADVSVMVRGQRGGRIDAARSSAGEVQLAAGTVSWRIPAVDPGSTLSLVLESSADTLAQEPTVVWRNISSVAEVSIGGVAAGTVASHGPKVIPPQGGYETARYGDRPFPVVPVDYADFKHASTNPADKLDAVLNDPNNPGSTFNLYQEMSFGQLFPRGTVASEKAKGAAPKPEDKLVFSALQPTAVSTCVGAAPVGVNPVDGTTTPAYTQRVSNDGWYQLPWTRGYYGSDGNGSALVGALGGVSALQAIDSGCGPTAKAAYDAAVAADPDIDYNDYDTNKDGVVDFFEVVFAGCGGNGSSQLSVAGSCSEAPNDNIWPHSSSLEFSYTDPKTGLSGYISKDRLKDLEGNSLFYTDDSYTKTTTTQTAYPAYVRVGPYNVNPETAIDKASVISHEYGHSLGLPDYYSTGSRETYGDFSLMATDQSQNLDVVGKKEMGWIVPEVLTPGSSTSVRGWRDSKVDTGIIRWRTPDGTPYTLSAAGGDYGISNGQAYVASLPGRQLLDPAKVKNGASGKRVWYSRQGNDFGCPPTGGRNLDIAIPGLENVPAGTPITASFKSSFQIEWDYDYGFVMAGTPDSKGKVAYTALPSQKGYTTPAAQNPNANTCQAKFGNGLTGTPASYDAGTAPVDRVAGNYPDAPFVADSYDLSSLAGVKGGVLRFTYATDPGLAKFGWAIDDLVVKAGDKVLFSSDFENDGGPNDPRVFPGGCKEDLSVSGGQCTQGWAYVAAGTPSEMEHAYLLEMRDRSGFDFNGNGQADRGGAQFEPGLLLTYTDEAHGYGNVGTDNPPAQSPLDSTPTPLSDAPALGDAAFTAAASRNAFTDAKSSPHIDNYGEPTRDPARDPGGKGTQPWVFDFDCLSFRVDKLAGNTANAAAKRDLVGDVTLTTGSGCAPFNYGTGAAGPTAAVPVTAVGSTRTGAFAAAGRSAGPAGKAGAAGAGSRAALPAGAGGTPPARGDAAAATDALAASGAMRLAGLSAGLPAGPAAPGRPLQPGPVAAAAVLVLLTSAGVALARTTGRS